VVGGGCAIGRPTCVPAALATAEQAEKQYGDAAHAFVGRVDGHRVGEGANVDATFGQLVDEVEDLAQVPPEAIESVDDKRVTGAGVDVWTGGRNPSSRCVGRRRTG
jgi:hypothetical protein